MTSRLKATYVYMYILSYLKSTHSMESAAAGEDETGEVEDMEVQIEEDEMIKEISCAHCLEVEGYLLNPKTLPCGHTFCETCLLNHMEKKKIVECRTCL